MDGETVRWPRSSDCWVAVSTSLTKFSSGQRQEDGLKGWRGDRHVTKTVTTCRRDDLWHRLPVGIGQDLHSVRGGAGGPDAGETQENRWQLIRRLVEAQLDDGGRADAALQRGWAIANENLAVVDDRHPVAELVRLLDVMGRE